MNTLMTCADVAKQLRRYRYEAGADGAEAAALIGKAPTTLYKYEAGRLAISEEDLITLLIFYGVDLDSAFSAPLRGQASRKKNSDARRLREIESIWRSLPEGGKDHLLACARCAEAYFAHGAEGELTG